MKPRVFRLVPILFLTMGAGPIGHADAPKVPPNSFETLEVGKGIYAFVSPQTTSGVINGNCVAVVGEDAVLVVDAGQFPLTTRRMIDEIRKHTDKKVRYLVNTHWHADHVLGNQEYRRAFPGVVVLSHDETRRLMLKNRELVLQLPTEGPGFLQALLAVQQRGASKNGSPLTEVDRLKLGDQIRDLEAVQEELKEVRFEPPDTTFSSTLTVHLGNRDVRLSHLGRGNTAGDVVAFVPDAGVLITGDVVVAPVPFGYGCYPGEWLQVLDKLLALDTSAIVPGHGPVMRDKVYIQRVKKLLESLRSEASKAEARGLTLEETRGKLDLGAIRSEFTHGDPLLDHALEAFFLDAAVARAYEEAKGRPLAE